MLASMVTGVARGNRNPLRVEANPPRKSHVIKLRCGVPKGDIVLSDRRGRVESPTVTYSEQSVPASGSAPCMNQPMSVAFSSAVRGSTGGMRLVGGLFNSR